MQQDVLDAATTGLSAKLTSANFARVAEQTPPSSLVERHRAWSELNERLREQERQLASEIAAYARGLGPKPESTIATVKQLRAECASSFKAMMDATHRYG